MSITLPKGCKPSKACGTDLLRPTLRHGYIRHRNGQPWVCTTDSYCAVAVRVAGDVKEGWIPIDVLKLMERTKTGLSFEQVNATTWKVVNKYEKTTVTYTADGLDNAEFPDFDKLGVFASGDLAGKSATPFGVNPELVARVGAAFGSALRVEVEGPLKAIRCTPIDQRTGKTGSADRYALLMPLRLLDEDVPYIAPEKPRRRAKAAA